MIKSLAYTVLPGVRIGQGATIEEYCVLGAVPSGCAPGDLETEIGEGAHLRARQLLERDVVTALATDAHNLKARRPELREGMQAAAEIVGGRAAHDLVFKGPLAIIGHRSFVSS